MPSPKPSNSMISLLETHSQEYAVKSTKLSNMLEQAEEFLKAMPGKSETEVVGDDEYQCLAFNRDEGEWRLRYWECYETEEGYRARGMAELVTEAKVEVKVAAALLLPKLIMQIVNEQLGRVQLLDSALEKLDDISFVFEGGK